MWARRRTPGSTRRPVPSRTRMTRETDASEPLWVVAVPGRHPLVVDPLGVLSGHKAPPFLSAARGDHATRIGAEVKSKGVGSAGLVTHPLCRPRSQCASPPGGEKDSLVSA